MNNFKENNFDLIRLFAALQVVLFHSIEYLNVKPEGVGNYLVKYLGYFPGVPIFFVLSGFLISMSYERNPEIKRYFVNRILRIYPALWACLIFSLVVVSTLGGWEKSTFTTLSFIKWIIAQLTIFQSYNSMFLNDFGNGALNGSLWTIPIEIQFYLGIPLLYFGFQFFKRYNWLLVTLISITVLCSHYFFAYRYADLGNYLLKIIGLTALPYLYMFLFGVFLQKNFKLVYPYVKGKALLWLLFYFLVCYSFEYLGLPVGGNHPNFVIVVVLSLTILSFAYSKKSLSRKLLNRNDISYGVYIYHMVIINSFIELGFVKNVLGVLSVYIITIILALGSWFRIEKPAMARKPK